jgi:hypothetical protein
MTVLKLDELTGIDVHAHAEVSCRCPMDEVGQEYEKAANVYFKVGTADHRRDSIAVADRF